MSLSTGGRYFTYIMLAKFDLKEILCSVTGFGDLLDFGQLFKACKSPTF